MFGRHSTVRPSGCLKSCPPKMFGRDSIRSPLGTYGDPNAGDPIQYDELRIERDQGSVEIIVYNRAIR